MKKLSEANIDVREDILQDLQQLAKEYELDKLILFGSRARRTNHKRSDIDIAAYFGDSVKYLDFCDSVDKIETLLMFDIVNLSSELIDADLRVSIEMEGIIIYEKV